METQPRRHTTEKIGEPRGLGIGTVHIHGTTVTRALRADLHSGIADAVYLLPHNVEAC